MYLRELQDMAAEGVHVASSQELAQRTGFSSEQIRKDLAYFGAFGTRGVGYDTSLLEAEIRRILGLQRGVKVALVGAGNLGTALTRYSQQEHKDVRISVVFDADPAKVGQEIEGLRILPAAEMGRVIREMAIKVAVLAVPGEVAQAVLDELMDAGIEAVLNFSPVKLRARPGVTVQNIDLTMELQSLVYYTSEAKGTEEEAILPDAAAKGGQDGRL